MEQVGWMVLGAATALTIRWFVGWWNRVDEPDYDLNDDEEGMHD